MASTFRSFGEATPASGAGSTIACAAQTISAGDLIVVGVCGTDTNNPGTSSITDTIGNSYSMVFHQTNAAATDWCELWYCNGSTGANASNIVTVHYVGTPTFRRAGADAWSSTLGTSWSVDGTPGGANNSTTSFTVAMGTNTQAEVIGFNIVSAGGTGTWTAVSGGNLRMTNGTDTNMEDKTFSTSAAQNMGWTVTTANPKWSAAAMFKAGAGTTVVRSLGSTGAGR